MNSNLPRWTVSPREKPPPIKRSPSEETVNVDKGTIGMSKEKAHYKSPFLVHQLSVFSAMAKYMVVKITCSSSEVVL
jgi:hypothetical protein